MYTHLYQAKGARDAHNKLYSHNVAIEVTQRVGKTQLQVIEKIKLNNFEL